MLKRITLIFILGMLSLWVGIHYTQVVSHSRSVLSWATTSTQQLTESAINNRDIIEATNKERVAIGLSPLSTNTKLGVSAEVKVDDMIARQYFEHQSPTGEGVSDLGRKAGYEYVVMGENLALGTFSSSAEIVKAWMDSPGHRANMLNPKYQDIGVSVKRGIYEGKEVWFAVQHFGTSRSVCPSINEGLKEEIDSINSQLRQEEKGINTLKKALEAPGAQSDPSYQSNVKTFNQSVDAYNATLAISRGKIELYNAQVRNFNKCIATFQ